MHLPRVCLQIRTLRSQLLDAVAAMPCGNSSFTASTRTLPLYAVPTTAEDESTEQFLQAEHEARQGTAFAAMSQMNQEPPEPIPEPTPTPEPMPMPAPAPVELHHQRVTEQGTQSAPAASVQPPEEKVNGLESTCSMVYFANTLYADGQTSDSTCMSGGGHGTMNGPYAGSNRLPVVSWELRTPPREARRRTSDLADEILRDRAKPPAASPVVTTPSPPKAKPVPVVNCITPTAKQGQAGRDPTLARAAADTVHTASSTFRAFGHIDNSVHVSAKGSIQTS